MSLNQAFYWYEKFRALKEYDGSLDMDRQVVSIASVMSGKKAQSMRERIAKAALDRVTSG